MAREIVTQRLVHAQQLKELSFDGYSFAPEPSDDVRWIFQRPQPPPAGR